jgi:hypothetical protein
MYVSEFPKDYPGNVVLLLKKTLYGTCLHVRTHGSETDCEDFSGRRK